MFFASDNAGPVHPKLMDAMLRANENYAMPYGADKLSLRLRDHVREVFEAPEAAVFLVSTGTAANVLALATLGQPYQTIFCTPNAHIHEDECNAPEFFTGGAKLTLVPSSHAKMTPETLRTAILGEEIRGVHGPQRGPVSLTNVTEAGTVYTPSELAALTQVAHEFELPVHLDGARFANAVAATGTSPAGLSWQAGVDALSFGGTKNGAMGVEAVIFFDPKHAWEFELRRKRGAHLASKHRFLAAQMSAYLQDGLWLDLAQKSNAANARLVRGLKQIENLHYLHEPEANIGFAQWARASHQRLQDAGAQYYLMQGALAGDDPAEPLTARMVCDWSITPENIDRFIDLARG